MFIFARKLLVLGAIASSLFVGIVSPILAASGLTVEKRDRRAFAPPVDNPRPRDESVGGGATRAIVEAN